jgi:glucose-1-phosphate thymidylyltransferase
LIVPPVHLGSDVVLESAVIGPYATVADGAVVRRSIVSDSILGRGALVENSILTGSLVGDNAIVRGRPHTMHVGDSSQINAEGMLD